MKKTVFAAVAALALAACDKAHDNPENFIGVWENTAPAATTASDAATNFHISDRILIESKGGGVFAVSILARGVFTDMRYVKDKGYLCAENNACFDLKDKDTLRVGSGNNITKEYKRSR